MAARWKREASTTLVLMHAHNQMSRWYGYLFNAAESLGLIVGYRTYANHYDGSCDREWYCITHQLEAAGGMAEVKRVAHLMRDRAERITETEESYRVFKEAVDRATVPRPTDGQV